MENKTKIKYSISPFLVLNIPMDIFVFFISLLDLLDMFLCIWFEFFFILYY